MGCDHTGGDLSRRPSGIERAENMMKGGELRDEDPVVRSLDHLQVKAEGRFREPLGLGDEIGGLLDRPPQPFPVGGRGPLGGELRRHRFERHLSFDDFDVGDTEQLELDREGVSETLEIAAGDAHAAPRTPPDLDDPGGGERAESVA